jgi:hypothetical protein
LTQQSEAGRAERAVTAVQRRLVGRHVARKVAGVILLGVGLIGLLMPILPGWLLIFVGLALLGVKLPFVERMKERARGTAPRKPNA